MRFIPVAIIVLLLTAACQQRSATVQDQRGGEWRSLQGAVLVVNQGITVPAGRARVFLQNTSPDGTRSGTSFDSYRPHCAFEVDSVDHEGYPIQPGTFTISRVQRTTVQVVQRESVRVAGLAVAGIIGRGSALHDGFHFWLTSADQPGVRRLTCYGVFAAPIDLYPPTLAEIELALGALATIQR